MSDGSDRVSFECWRLDDTRATLNNANVTGTLDVARPDCGLHDLRLNDAPLDWRLMNVGVGTSEKSGVPNSGSWQLVDRYVRGWDLVAVYREPLGQPFNLELYWRVLKPTATTPFTLELLASVQTRLWEAHPWVSVRSELARARMDKSDGQVVFQGDQTAYVELPYPGDFQIVESDAACGASWRYGPVFMERGVIRRLRLRGVLIDKENAASAIEETRKALLTEELPLTA
jgi:hypothetical protein